MNCVVVYGLACFLFCVICLWNRVKSEGRSVVGVDSLRVGRRDLLIFFIIFAGLTFILPVFLSRLICKIFANYKFPDAEVALLSTVISQVAAFIFICHIRRCFHLGTSNLTALQILKIGLSEFGVVFLAIVGVSCVWVLFLIFLKNHGINVSMEDQAMALLFGKIHSLLFKVLFFLAVVFLAPVIEEYVFRAGIYRILKANLNTKLAIRFTSFMFASVHMNLVSLIPLYFLSNFLIRSYENSGNIFVPIAIHAAFNCNSFIFIALTSC